MVRSPYLKNSNGTINNTTSTTVTKNTYVSVYKQGRHMYLLLEENVISIQAQNNCHFAGSPIPQPNKIENAHFFVMGNTTVYTCMSGYESNGGESVIFYNGTQWDSTDLNCTGRIHIQNNFKLLV